jgi:hypothetical protein
MIAYDVYVFLKTSEEAVCNDTLGLCKFTFMAPAATVSTVTPAFDESIGAHKITVTGTSFGTDLSACHLYIDGQA